MEVDPLDVEMKFHMENQHEYINTIEAFDEWATWRDELTNERLKNQLFIILNYVVTFGMPMHFCIWFSVH